MTDELQVRQQIGERLRLAREQAGLSQGQAARKLDLHRPTVSEIEAGRRRLGAEEITQFAKLYGVDVNFIVTGGDVEADPAIQMAARVLASLKKEDAERILKALRRLPPSGASK